MNNALDILKNNSVFWSKLGYCYDPPRLDENGQEILFAEDFEHFTRIQNDFVEAGIKIVSSILFSGWMGIDTFDYTLTDEVLEAVFRKNPDIYYIPRIKLNVPVDWCRENPEEVFVYYDGPRDAGEIRRLVGTSEHDILGYDAEYGYQNTFGYVDDRPNVNGKIALQSFSSQKWLADAGYALEKIIRRLEASPYADRILAYHLAYGVCGETCVWGRFNKKYPGDWGIANGKAFFRWGIEKYGSVEVLQEAWNLPSLPKDSVYAPAPESVAGSISSLRELMRCRKEDRICIDYELFSSDINVDAMEHFGRIAKTLSDGKPIGYFYGYVLECDNAGYSGWLGYDRILESDYIDFIAAPKSYYRNGPREPGGFLGLPQSVNRKKIWLDEIDNHTHLVPESSCRDFAESKGVLWREFAKNLSVGANFWWMDLGGGWYDDPGLMNEVRVMEKLAHDMRRKPHKSVADILVVVDEKSLAHVKRGGPLHHYLVKDLLRELSLSGGVYDLYRLEDLSQLDLSQYKLIVPLNLFDLDTKEFDMFFGSVSRESFYLWFYAAGFAAPGWGVENIEALTGIKAEEKNPQRTISINFDSLPSMVIQESELNLSLPLLKIIETDGTEIIGRYRDFSGAVCRRGKTFYSAVPLLRAVHLRHIMKTADCRLHTEEGNIYYADNRFECIISDNEVKLNVRS